MTLSQPSLWISVVLTAFMGVSIWVRFFYAVGWGGRAYILLAVPVAWWFYLTLLRALGIPDLTMSDTYRAATAWSVYIFIGMFTLTNFRIAWEERKLRHKLKELKLPQLLR